MSVLIRAATAADARRIAEIHVAGWQTAYRGQMPDAVLDGLSVEKRESQWRGWITTPTTPEHRTWVAADDDGVVAFANTGASRDADATADVAELVALYADPVRWGTGAGRALMSHVTQDLASRECGTVTLWVLDTNARARRFYEIAGFAVDGAEKRALFGGVSLREVRYRSTRCHPAKTAAKPGV